MQRGDGYSIHFEFCFKKHEQVEIDILHNSGSKCTCPCNQHYNQNSTDAQSGSAAGNTYLNKNNNQTNLTLEEKIAVIVKEIQIDKKKTTSYHRRKTSAPDTRPLSAGIGLTAAAILGGCVLAIVAMDAQRIGEGVHAFWNGLHRIFKFWLLRCFHLLCCIDKCWSEYLFMHGIKCLFSLAPIHVVTFPLNFYVYYNSVYAFMILGLD